MLRPSLVLAGGVGQPRAVRTTAGYDVVAHAKMGTEHQLSEKQRSLCLLVLLYILRRFLLQYDPLQKIIPDAGLPLPAA